MELFELNEQKELDGRRRFRASLHEIYPDESGMNNNGICYLEQYTRANMESAKGIPVCCEFVDGRKREPLGHGETGVRNKDGMVMFEDSIVVGVVDDVTIEDAQIEGNTKRVLMATGYIYEQRYPNLVEWIEQRLNANMAVRGSVEFIGKAENNGEIKYLNDFNGMGRIPTEYVYSGYCLLSVPAGDNAAVVFELNESKDGEQEKDKGEQCHEEIVGNG